MNQELKPSPVPTRIREITRAVVAFIMASGLVFFNIGLHQMWAMLDGIGYGIFSPLTWVSYLFLAFCVATVFGLTTAFRRQSDSWLFLFFISPFGIFGMCFLGISLAIHLHFPRVCDTMDAQLACRASTWRDLDTCEVGDVCYRRIEKACRIGVTERCGWLQEQGHWTSQEVCTALRDRCEYVVKCQAEGQECDVAELPRIESIDHDHGTCKTYERWCGKTKAPSE